jgi:hypothetical protein
MAGDTRYVYSLSSRPRFVVQNAIRSIRSLCATTDVDPSDVVVFLTPPVDPSDVEQFREVGLDVREVEPVFADGFRTHLGDSFTEYAEKWRLTEVTADTVVFLDCDTVVLDDLSDVLEGEFDFKARPLDPADPERFVRLFDRRDLPRRDWYPNTGFMVFKNGYHREVSDDWRRYIREELSYYSEGFTKEQFALALATTDGEFTAMSKAEHVMEWFEEVTVDGYVHHLANADVSVAKELVNAVDGRLPDRWRNALGSRFPGLYDRTRSR